MPQRLIGWLLLLLPVGCSLLMKPANLDTLPLPDLSALPCCWQAQESLQVEYRHKRHQLTSVIAVQEDGLKFIVFDPLGRRLLTVTQQGANIDTSLLDTNAELPVRWLLPAIYLSYVNRQSWDTAQSPWSVSEHNKRLTLFFQRRPAVAVQGFTDGDLPQTGEQRIIRFHEQQLTLQITTLSSKAL